VAAQYINPTGGGGGAPSGPAGGVLGGTYPNPAFAVDMATQAELDAAVATLQPLDSDLTAIAALATTSYGRALLTLANLAALYTLLSVDTDATLAAASDTRLPSQKAVKTYADQLIAAQDAMVFKGVIDCSTNPNYPAADRGHTYRVSVAGKIGGAAGIVVEAGDIAICLTDGTASGNQATVGAAWTIVQTNLDGAVIGPASAASGNLPTFNGATGKLLQDSGVAPGSLTPITRTITAGTGLTGGGDLSANRTLAPDFGTGVGKVTQGNDARLSDARTPTTHAASHGSAGSDPVTPGAIGGALLVEAVTALSNSGAAVTVPDVTSATLHRYTLTAACTFTFPTAAAGKSFTLELVQDATGSRTATWPGTVKWPAGTAPTLTTTATKRDFLTFVCSDGTNWIGFASGLNYA
jgi:hypothetical protein